MNAERLRRDGWLEPMTPAMYALFWLGITAGVIASALVVVIAVAVFG